MAQTIQLVLGTASAISADITVAAGAEAVIGIYAEPGRSINEAGSSFNCTLLQDTPGTDNQIISLNSSMPSVIVKGPNVFRVQRPSALVQIGVFSE